jgi:glycosyltransferase involved in cell wall biosynthesis
MSKTLRISDRVHFAGRISHEEIFSAIKGFDIAVVPSRLEGFGLSAVEAMAAGIPLIASNVDALAEVVLDSETGLLFEPEKPNDLANKIAQLFRSPFLLNKIGNAAKIHVFKNYNQENYYKKVSKLILDLN